MFMAPRLRPYEYSYDNQVVYNEEYAPSTFAGNTILSHYYAPVLLPHEAHLTSDENKEA